MLILTIRTDNPRAEIGLYDDAEQLAYDTWEAHRELAATLHARIRDLLVSQRKGLSDLGGIAGFAGPGSFTGLRIGLTVANTLAYSLDRPVVAVQGEDWIAVGIAKLQNGQPDPVALPHYGAPVHITLPQK